MGRSSILDIELPVRWSLVLSILLLASSFAIVFATLKIQPSDAACDRFVSPWSPALQSVKYHWETFENHRFSIKTPYFGFEPTDEIENAWNNLLPSMTLPYTWTYQLHFLNRDTESPISIPSSHVQALGHLDMASDSRWVRDPDDPDAILALPEYAVQLGCLNFLRQVGYRTHRDFTDLASFQGGDSLVWERAYQCLERLRRAIMCWGDTGTVALYHDDHGNRENRTDMDVSFDFGTLHYCRNIDDLDKWMKENGVEGVVMDNLWWGGSANVVKPVS